LEETKLKEVLDSLSLKEKIGQLIQLSGEFFSTDDKISTGPQKKLGISDEMIRLTGSVLNVAGAKKTRKIQEEYLKSVGHQIPLLFMGDIVYGYKTTFPVPIGMSSTWNLDLIEKTYQTIAEETSSAGVHVTFAPMVDLVRDPRWGRVVESLGEDPYLSSKFTEAMVSGLQNDWNPLTSIASCVKHFAAYGASEGGRDYNTVDMSERELRGNYLPMYKAAVDAGVEMVMTSFNTYDGVPVTGNEFLLKEILRNEWGFDGVIISDYAAIRELVDHGLAENERVASKLALEATTDIDMKTNAYASQLEPLVKDGEISEALIDESVWRVLKLKNDLGLFEDPFRSADEEREKDILLSDENRKLARDVSSESITLLQNNDNVLPLNEKEEKILLTGPYADSKSLIGFWAVHADSEDVVSLKEGIESYTNPNNFQYTQGSDMNEDYSFLMDFGATEDQIEKIKISPDEKKEQLESAIRMGEKADTIILALGEHTLQSGEAGSRTDLTLPKIQQDFLDEMIKLEKKTVLVVFGGRPLALTKEASKVDAILQAWFPGTEGGNALADILFGMKNPSGRLTMSFPNNVGQIPLYYNHYNTGRPLNSETHTGRFVSKYLDSPNTPLYPFGFGLSYSEIEYSNLVLDSDTMNEKTAINISVTVSNKSRRKAKEVVQLYVQDEVGSVVRPVKELKGFKKVILNGNTSKNIKFILSKDDLKYYTKDMSYDVEPGDFKIFVGPNSRDVLEESFTLV